MVRMLRAGLDTSLPPRQSVRYFGWFGSRFVGPSMPRGKRSLSISDCVSIHAAAACKN